MVFNSFLWAGYECADHINSNGERVNSLSDTAHDLWARKDYALIAELGIKTVREGICWSEVEKKPYEYDFLRVYDRIQAGQEYGIQQIWDICHFGYPDDLIPTHPHFTKRFTSLCEAFARFYQRVTDEVLYVVPINEISFLSWYSGDVRGTVPFAVNAGFDIKYHLCKAAIQGIIALKKVLPNCVVFLVEPLVQVHGGCHHTPEEVLCANESQYQAMDIIMGKMCPELGGNPSIVDVLGFNYYFNCQWEYQGNPLEWPSVQGCKRVPLGELLNLVYQKYNKPIVLSETGHFGEGRGQWIHEVVQQCKEAINEGVDLRGICLYPIIGRPDWNNFSHYHDSGLWDLDENKNRIPCTAAIEAVKLYSKEFRQILV